MISIVIPALNEEASLRNLLPALLAEAEAKEIILSDGGSCDGTVGVARSFGIRVVVSEQGRGQQIRTGVAAACGDTFLFLHADSGWPRGGLHALRAALDENPSVIGGNFRLLFDGGDGFSTWLNGFYRWLRAHGFYYGDSGMFVRASVYETLGGMRAVALMEDYDLVRRLERAGQTICIADPPLVTSSRRFSNRKPFAIVSGWLLIHALFLAGVSPARLARLYRSARH